MSKHFISRRRAVMGYRLARRMLDWPWLVKQDSIWQWMQGQFSRMANLGDVGAQSFYGHILWFKGQGPSAKQEGRRLLMLAADGGDAKAAFQLGRISLEDQVGQSADAAVAATFWEKAVEGGHPLAARKLASLYHDGGPGLAPNQEKSEYYQQRAQQMGI